MTVCYILQKQIYVIFTKYRIRLATKLEYDVLKNDRSKTAVRHRNNDSLNLQPINDVQRKVLGKPTLSYFFSCILLFAYS